MDMWTMRLRRSGLARGQRAALPTADPFAHMPTAFNQQGTERTTTAPVALFCEATWGVSSGCRLTLDEFARAWHAFVFDPAGMDLRQGRSGSATFVVSLRNALPWAAGSRPAVSGFAGASQIGHGSAIGP